MLDIKWIRENPEALDKALASRGAGTPSGDLIAADEQRRALVQSLQDMQSRRNAASKEIGQAMGQGDKERAEALKAEVSEIKTRMQDAEEASRAADQKLNDLLMRLPNLPLAEVPVGSDEADNREDRKVGEKPTWNHKPLEHFEIGEALGWLDFETAAKLSGSRFTVVKGQLARLERAMGQFMLDLHTSEHGLYGSQSATAGAR